MKFNLLLIVFICFFSGCMVRNPYPEFYRQSVATADELVFNYKNNPQVRHSSLSSFYDRVAYFEKKGLVLIGTADFEGGQLVAENNLAVQHGKKIGASLVLIAKELVGTRSGNLQLTTPTQNTTYHSGNVNLYGSDGSFNSGSYYGSSTTYGTQTTNIPYTVRRYRIKTAFFAKKYSQEHQAEVDRLTREAESIKLKPSTEEWMRKKGYFNK